MKYLLIILAIIGGIIYGTHVQSGEQYVVYATTEKKELPRVSPVPTPPPTTHEIVAEIAKVFEPEGTQVVYEALSVAKNESGWRVNAKGYNCHYDGVSGACRKGDEHLAWSVDCGILQINVKGQECPEHLLNLKPNVLHGYKMFKNRHWQPWVAARKLGLTK